MSQNPPIPPRPDLFPYFMPGPGLAAQPTLRDQFGAATWWWQDMVLVLFAASGGTLLVLDLLKIWGGASSSALNSVGSLLQEVFLLWAVLMWVRRIRPAPLSVFGKSQGLWKDIGIGIGMGWVGLFANSQVSRVSREVGRLILGHEPVSNSILDQQGAGAKVAIGLALVVGAPIAEELFFRGFVYGGLRRRLNVPAAVIISATVFALVHFYLIRIPSVFALGVILALVYERRRNLIPSMIAHSVNNAIVFLVAIGSLKL